jgi:hypothetical protein
METKADSPKKTAVVTTDEHGKSKASAQDL